MSQIAQQDHLYVEVGNVEQLTTEEKALLKEKAKNGTLLDVVLKDQYDCKAKIIGYDNAAFAYYATSAEELMTVVF